MALLRALRRLQIREWFGWKQWLDMTGYRFFKSLKKLLSREMQII